MPLSGSAMGDAVAAAVKGAVPPASAAISDAQLMAIWEAACNAIVAHIKANAVVTVPAAGLISGSPGAPVSGSAMGQIT